MQDLQYFLQDMGLIFLLAVGVILFCFRLRIPPIIGFLLTGMLVGPAGLKLIDDVHTVEMMAEIGVVLLLFTIGIEFSLAELWQIRRPILLGGGFQVLATLAAGTGLGLLFGLPWQVAVFAGFLLSLSSTAIVLKLLQDKAEMEAPQGRLSLAVLIFQDVAAIPMMLLVPVLAGVQRNTDSSWGWVAFKIIAVIAFVLLAARYMIPWLLAQVVRTRIRELFLITVAGLCLGIAWLSASLGLSLALGAFIAGLIISESEYSHQAMGYILPFRDVFTSLFFVSTGMLLSISGVIEHIGLIIWLLPLLLLLKALLAAGAGLILGYSARISVMVGLFLAQIGEFSLVVGKLGHEAELLDSSQYQLFLALSILSMIVTPVAFWLAPRLARRLPDESLSDIHAKQDLETPAKLLIIGYGIGGRNLARAAAASDVPYRVMEMNWDTVRKERALGIPIQYGDATQLEVLQHLGMAKARILVVMTSDATATRRIVELAHREFPHVWVLVRSRFVYEIDALYELGADEVVAEEFESSIEVFSRVLNRFLIPKNEIVSLISEIRGDHYEIFRHTKPPQLSLKGTLPDFEWASVRIQPGSPLVGASLQTSHLRNRFDVTVIAIERAGQTHTHPDPSWAMEAQDILMVMGKPEAILNLSEAVKSKI